MCGTVGRHAALSQKEELGGAFYLGSTLCLMKLQNIQDNCA
jgi:hypothetical protein